MLGGEFYLVTSDNSEGMLSSVLYQMASRPSVSLDASWVPHAQGTLR